MLVWLYHRVEFAKRKKIGPRVTIRGLPPGRYRVRWFDADTGAMRKTEAATAAPTVVTAPPFSGHIVCLVEVLRN